MPHEGTLVVIPAIYNVSQLSTCAVDGDILRLECSTFLNIVILGVTYGRKAKEVNLCNGKKEKAPATDCLSTDFVNKIHESCRGNYSCELIVSPGLAVLESCGELSPLVRSISAPSQFPVCAHA